MGYCTPGESGIHYIADEERDNTMDMELAAECVTQMENLIRGGSREELENYLKDVFGKLEVQQDAALKCKFLIFRMSSALIRIAYTVTEDSALLQRFAMLEGPIRESRDRFTALCLEVWELVNAGKKKSSQILCEKAMQIIDKEYGDPSLSLVGVSNSIHVSPNYLSARVKLRGSVDEKEDRNGKGTGTGQFHEDAGDCGALRLQRSALFQLLL